MRECDQILNIFVSKYAASELRNHDSHVFLHQCCDEHFSVSVCGVMEICQKEVIFKFHFLLQLSKTDATDGFKLKRHL